MGLHWQLSASATTAGTDAGIFCRRRGGRWATTTDSTEGGLHTEGDRTIIVAAVPDRARCCWIVTYRTPRPILARARRQSHLAGRRGECVARGRNPTLRGQQAQELLAGRPPQHCQRLPARLQGHPLHLRRLAALIRRYNRTTANGKTTNAFTRFKGSMVAAGKSNTRFEAAYLWPRRNTSNQT